ncbi:MAG: alpha-ribazole phosphatase family protein [Gammaproteobacteria bacterium]|mgnify:CR=1 FL=1|jgi:alpha-ribazole phosphatase|nr:alpha-ribazole phosphatase family protein [Gammaproteobacteria bacterium]MBT4491773.1 alpha-ribazole phosphatase family protein [Gammaproteobacteria bacterium]
MPVTLLRHTELTVKSDFCYGDLDVALADSFEEDASRVLASLPDFDEIYTSPLVRCRQLAELIAERSGCDAIPVPALSEMNFGTWQGKNWDDIPVLELDAWADEFENARPHGGESIAQFRSRLRGFIKKHPSAPGRKILFVTHGGVIRVLLAMAHQQDEREIQIGYGEVVELNLPHTKDELP